VGEPENERNRRMLREAIAPFTDEEIVSVGWFDRGESTGDSWRKGPRLLRRLLSTSDHAADNTGTYKRRTLRATMTLDGEPRPLVMDFPTIPISKEVIAAVQEATT
jgi:hypothetical protein